MFHWRRCVSRLKPGADAKGVLVSGRDYREPSADSPSGASWILPLASLERLGAFLAVRMNGEALPVDHGKPVRLVVPGWYGCAWIKWVDEIRLVGEREAATSQMKEFAGRTHQAARHDLAIDYTPPDIQAAAMPVRVEKRRVSTVSNIASIASSGSSGGALSPWIASRSVSATMTLDAVFRLPDSHDACGLVAVGIPLAAGFIRGIQHQPASARFVGSAASPRDRILHAPDPN